MNGYFKNIKFACMLLLAVSVSARTVEQKAGQSIHVIAVHDSSLFTLCAPPLWEELAGGLSQRMRSFGRYYMNVISDGRLTLVPLGFTDPARPGYAISILPPPFFDHLVNTLERARPDWPDLSRLTSGISPSGWVDPQIKKEIETELRKQKEYALVDSPERADFVFLAEGLYYVYWSPAEGTRISNSVDGSRAAFGKQVRSAIIGVVVPSEVYRQYPTG